MLRAFLGRVKRNDRTDFFPVNINTCLTHVDHIYQTLGGEPREGRKWWPAELVAPHLNLYNYWVTLPGHCVILSLCGKSNVVKKGV